MSLDSYYDLLNTKIYNIANETNEDILAARWNTYYYKKYQSQNNLLLFIIGVCVVIIILKLIHRNFPYFDKTSYLTITGIIIALSIVILFYKLINIYYRDDRNFDEMDYGYSGGRANPTNNTDISYNKFDMTDSCTVPQVKTLANSIF